MHRLLVLSIALSAFTMSAHAQSDNENDKSVWSVDLIRTLPGMQDEYLRNIEANWAGARHLALDRGVIKSYRALASEPDSARGWDVMLITEYTDTASWERREEAFREIFDSPEFVRLEMAVPNSEMREFVGGGVVMRSVAGDRH